MSFCEADKVQLILLTFAETSSWMAVSPKLSLGHVLQARDTDTDSQDLGFDGAGQKRLVSWVGSELNSQIASGGG